MVKLLFKNYTIEKYMFVITNLLVLACLIFFNTWLDVVIALSVITGLVSSYLVAKGKWYGFIFNSISYILYIYFCYILAYYGEFILSFVIIGADTISLIKWKNNQTADNVVEIKKLKAVELLIVFILFVVATIVYGITLYYFNSSLPFINAIATTFILFGYYIAYKQNILQYLFWIGYDVALIFLFLFASAVYEPGYLMFVLSSLLQVLYHIYGVINWRKLFKTQTKNNQPI